MKCMPLQPSLPQFDALAYNSRKGATSKRGKKLHGGGRRGRKAEDDHDNSSDDDSNRSVDG